MIHPKSVCRSLVQVGFFTLALVVMTQSLQASSDTRTWTIDGQQYEAILVDFNGNEVLLQNAMLQQEAVALDRLDKKDVAFVRAQVKQQKLKIRKGKLRGIDVWQVGMRAANGQLFTRNYQGLNSEVARMSAITEFPNASVQSIVKLQTGNLFRARKRAVALQKRTAKKVIRKANKNAGNKAKKQKAKGGGS